MKNPPMSGAEFRELRTPCGEQSEVAEILDVHRVTLSKWERDKQPIPGPARYAIRALNILAVQKQAKLAELDAQKQEIIDDK